MHIHDPNEFRSRTGGGSSPLQLLGCVRRLGGGQPRLALPYSCGVAARVSSRFLSTANAFAAAAAERHGASAVASTGRGRELAEGWHSRSSLSSRDPRTLQSSPPLNAVDHPVSQRDATIDYPTSRHPPNSNSSDSSSSSSGSSSSGDSTNESSSGSRSSSSSNNKSNDSVSQSEGREGAFGGRNELAELQRLLRERQQRQADVIPFKVRRTASDNLPVSLSWSHSRSQVRTVIRKVGGDRQVS
ncbi:hypothetical protein Emed_002775 [Eimeria media]